MSGGFFRGTTADQDTRFSNKQAKLMKSQKFAPELEHLVDMTKVKMDVLRPWIAKRVTELLGFEDEVLINFIYGLLDGKNVNGKEIQISITGFMEKNTGKFMKELWTLLLSAQNNASGVPQRFLDEKEEETKRKKADAERITNEIQKKKEREADESVLVQKKMEGGPDTSRTTATDDTLFSKRRNGREPFNSPDDRKESVGRNGRGRIARHSISSHSTESSPSPSRRRSMSRSPKARKRSISSEKEHPNRKGSITPHHTASSRRSPLSRRRSSYRWRSRSRSYSPSFSPQPLRSHHISPHVRRRRSPSPVRRRSPVPARRRSPPPGRLRSPPRRSRRSPSPVRRRSPPHRSRSPAKRGSRPLVRRQSHSLVHDRSPLLAPRRGRRGSTSSPSQGASPSPRRISRSPGGHRSPSPLRQKLSSPRQRRVSSPVVHGKRNQKAPSTPRHRHISPESRKPLASDGTKRHSPYDGRSLSPDLSISGSPIRQRSVSPYREKSPTHMTKLILPSSIEKHSSPKTRLGCKSRGEGNLGRSKREDELLDPNKEVPFKAMSLEKTVLSSDSPANTNGCPEDELRSRNNSRRKESKISLGSPIQVTMEPNSAQGELEIRDKFSVRGNNAKDVVEKGALLSEQNKMEGGGQHLKPENTAQKFMGKGVGGGSSDSGYADDKKRKRKGSSSRHEVSSDDDSSDSEDDAKRRRRKEEKRLRREKRRQRHEEKRRKKEEKRAEKHKSRKVDNPGIEKKIHDKSEDEEEEEEEKKRKLEIELRKKALESLKAKKGIGH